MEKMINKNFSSLKDEHVEFITSCFNNDCTNEMFSVISFDQQEKSYRLGLHNQLQFDRGF